METKKNFKANLEKKRFIFTAIGLSVVLAFVLLAFEYSAHSAKTDEYTGETVVIEEELIPITRPPQAEELPPPPPQEKVPELLEVVDNNVEITEPAVIHITEATENTVIAPTLQMAEEETETIGFYSFVDKMPEFEGGETALRRYLADNIRYPAIAAEYGIQGRVYVRFAVMKTGKVDSVSILRGVDPHLDAEALRVVKNMPKWQAGQQAGYKVNVWYTVPINFKLAN